MTIEELHEAARKAAAAREDRAGEDAPTLSAGRPRGPAFRALRRVGEDGHEYTPAVGSSPAMCQLCGLYKEEHLSLHTEPRCSCGGSGLRLSIVPWQCGPVHGMTVFCALCGAIRADQVMGVEQAPGRAVTPDGQPLIYTGV